MRYGLPTRQNLDPCTEYRFLDNYKFYSKHGLNDEELYILMKNKCPILSEKEKKHT